MVRLAGPVDNKTIEQNIVMRHTASTNVPQQDMRRLRRRLLSWYDRHRRELPWRALPGEAADPYRVWLSEIMLQQTTVATVKSYFERFLERWPDIHALAAADLDEVLHAWQGLGYYARARNLHRCARVLVAEYGGQFPDTEEELRRLPGIGEYTAAAVSAIAFGRKTTPVDGNIIRVMARLMAVGDPMPGSKSVIKELTAPLMPQKRAGDFAQALMDLGATVCTPRNPVCALCPWMKDCRAYQDQAVEKYPVKKKQRQRPVRHGVAYWITRSDGAVLLRRREEKGLLGGMMEVPSSDWREKSWSAPEARSNAPLKSKWVRIPGVVEHTFTHFHLELIVMKTRVRKDHGLNGTWCRPDEFSEFALPTVMKKVARLMQSS
jgi:A/G-specific adenine glycosylase